MYLIVGLGNPGEEYENTRHNAGFNTIDRLAEEIGVHYWKNECGALVGRGTCNDTDIILAKPQSYMNLSGGPVKLLMDAYDIPNDHVIIIHDDLDIAPGTIRVKFGGGHAGHNGLRSICDKTQTHDWFRVRIGIGRPPGHMRPIDYVLAQPRGDAARDFAYAVERGARAALYLIDNGLEQTQSEFN